MGVIMISPEYNHGMSGRPEECARLGLSALRSLSAEKQAGTDDDGLTPPSPAVCARNSR